MRRIAVAKAIFQAQVVGIQLKRHVGGSLAAGDVAIAAVVALRISQALLPTVVEPEGQTLGQPLLRVQLQRIVVLKAG